MTILMREAENALLIPPNWNGIHYYYGLQHPSVISEGCSEHRPDQSPLSLVTALTEAGLIFEACRKAH